MRRPRDEFDHEALAVACERKRRTGGLKKYQVCIAAGVSNSTYARIVSRPPRPVALESVVALAAWLGVPVGDFAVRHRGKTYGEAATPDKIDAALAGDPKLTDAARAGLSDLMRGAYKAVTAGAAG